MTANNIISEYKVTPLKRISSSRKKDVDPCLEFTLETWSSAWLLLKFTKYDAEPEDEADDDELTPPASLFVSDEEGAGDGGLFLLEIRFNSFGNWIRTFAMESSCISLDEWKQVSKHEIELIDNKWKMEQVARPRGRGVTTKRRPEFCKTARVQHSLARERCEPFTVYGYW